MIYEDLESLFPDAQVRALAEAAGNGDVAAIEDLVAGGADVNARGLQEATPLFWAMRNAEGFQRLLELGADPNVVFGDGGSVMHWAARSEDPSLLARALEHGGDPNLRAGARRGTPLAYAVGTSRATVELLLAAGADVNAQDENGDTPVMVAAALARFDAVHLLLLHGASYSLPNSSGSVLADRVATKRRVMTPEHKHATSLARVADWLEARGVQTAPVQTR